MAVTDDEFRAAEARGEDARQAGYAVSARYDRPSGRLIVALNTGVELAVPADRIEGLAGAEAAALAEIEISPSGLGLHWPALDADLYLPALLQGVFGSRAWMARQLGAAGGRAKTAAKAAAARDNGRKGGRPRRIAGSAPSA